MARAREAGLTDDEIWDRKQMTAWARQMSYW